MPFRLNNGHSSASSTAHVFFTWALWSAVVLVSLLLISSTTMVSAQVSQTPVTLPPAPLVPLPPIPMPAPLAVPVPTTPTASTLPLQMTTLPQLQLDVSDDSVGIAQETAHAQHLQGRVLWVDGTANIDAINTADKVKTLVDQAKKAGFNTIVFDVKPIVGWTLYPSRFAPKLTGWKGFPLPVGYDPLSFMVQDAHADGLQLVANMSTFGEGHKYFSMGPGYTNPSWQTIMYTAVRSVKNSANSVASVDIGSTNALAQDDSQLALFTDATLLRHSIPGATVDVVNFDGRVVAQVAGESLPTVTVDYAPQGALLVGKGRAGDYLKQSTRIGDILNYTSTPQYLPVTQVADQKITVFVNPNDPAVQQHELDIVREIVTNYNVDGMIFDDRMRYAALNADFSELTRAQFEQYIGKKINWPNDIFQINPYPNQDIIKGPYYDAWLVFRALTIRNWLADARAIVKSVRPVATVSVYVGSWFGEYANNGSNWAADDYAGPFPFLTQEYQKTGFAGLLDWVTTGCYYTQASIAEGVATNTAGTTVEFAGELSNRAVNDSTWVYAGLYAAQYENDPDTLQRCLQAAAASTQGIMVFDLSQINQFNMWPVFEAAFATPATAPHAVPGLLDTIRREHVEQKLQGIVPPPLPPYVGVSGTGL